MVALTIDWKDGRLGDRREIVLDSKLDALKDLKKDLDSAKLMEFEMELSLVSERGFLLVGSLENELGLTLEN